MSSSCRCDGCRYKYTHTYKKHKCGICGEFGHGQLEHNNPYAINNLKTIGINDVLKKELWCKSPGCIDPETHTETSHICEACGEYHNRILCLKKPYKVPENTNYKYIVKCPLCMTDNPSNDHEPILYGLSEKCQICQLNEINYRLTKCNHCCMCTECSEKIRIKY